jgi:cyclic beta-1,2-glucan synthetase
MGPLGALIWQILLIFSLFVAPTLSLISGVVPRSTDIVPQAHFHTLWSEVRATNAQVALRIVFIADGACLMADAIVRSLYRLFVSGKLMLEWRTAASIQSSAQGSIFDYYRQMWHAPVVALLGLIFAALPGDNAFLVGLPFALLWIFSPIVAWYVSQSAETEDRLFVSEHVSSELRKIARRTWRYYEAFVTSGENYLPPDNYQETPEPLVASRTSPTNIGVYLLSVISARQFGWISFSETVERMEKTIETVEKMDKYRGHLFNWYHNDTLQTLGPRYVSAVDSGNLAGHLIAISSACRQWAEAPSAHLQGNLDGIGDVAGILRETLKELPDDRKNLRPLHRRLEERIIGFSAALASVKREHEFASIRVINLAVLARDIQKLASNLDLEVKSGQSAEVTRWAQSLVDCCEAHISDSAFDLSTIDPLRERLTQPRSCLLDGFCLPLPQGSPSAFHRLPCGQPGTRRSLLRPSGIRMPPDQPVCHRQGRSADRALVSPGTSGRANRRAGRIGILVRIDVRISDAAARDAGASWRHSEPDEQSDRQGTDQPWPPSRHAMGHLRGCLQRPRPQHELPIYQLRRAYPGPEAWSWSERRYRTLRIDPGVAVRS